MSKWRKLRALPWRDRWLLARATMLLAGARMSLPCIDFRADPGAAERAQNARPSDAALERARFVAYMVAVAAGHLPFGVTCLHRSLVLRQLLRREGIAGDLRIGASTHAGPFGAHAWVQCGDLALGEDPAHLSRFSPFGEAVVPVLRRPHGRLAERRAP